MKYVDEFRDQGLARDLAAALDRTLTRPRRIMEVCGTHTMAVFRSGLRSLLPEGLELVSGPGCPVCVTSAAHVDAFLALAGRPGVRVATFGDLIRVPGSDGTSLAHARSQGAQVEVVYSPMDGLTLARNHPDETVVFLGVGFETTTPGVAATVRAARQEGLSNFFVFTTQKTMMPPLMALFGDPDQSIDGLLCPGHVSAIIGAAAYGPLAERYHLPCVVGGFEPVDILQALLLLVRQLEEGRSEVENAYTRVVSPAGNLQAQSLVAEVFEPVDMEWRGLGVIPGSGLQLRAPYRAYDAQECLGVEVVSATEVRGCLCGRILQGRARPPECPLFGSRCTPSTPIGPCMVSSEGTCSAYYNYSLSDSN
ncbi:MAG: hydrogenase formation protein HypD [Desulfobulbaceae bacterium]|uniref:Hydrogenase formation protein HypD n=1 Tax=Candidatus Desulfatifera sulfidica TaxID=2841691 RepID=A0A8J6T952_9BACT|nr:hydrogenase formation protein HypD [Candidatus Desulfatifera sulfidica]